MTKRKRFILYSFLVILCTFSTYNFIVAVRYHNSNHAPSINGEVMTEVDGYFIYKDSTSNRCYYLNSNYVQKNSHCRICREKGSLLIKVATIFNIVKEKSSIVNHKELIILNASNFGIIKASN